jgi:hypothetical protein
MLSAHIPDDQGRSDTKEPAEIRWNMGTLPNVTDTAQFRMEELCGSVKRMSGGKYLGPEMNDMEDFQRAMDGLHQEILKLVSGYLSWAIFSRKWQVETSSSFQKKRNRSSTKSYRPNCLLSMMGELLERLLAARMSTLSHHLELNADRQYGFRPGGSKTNAIVQLKEIAWQMSDKMYVFAIALDISGAVDNVWWPNDVHEVTRRVSPNNVCRLRRSYFADSTLQIVGKNEVIAKPVTKGFSQKSVMCPSFWDLIFDDLLDDLSTYTT